MANGMSQFEALDALVFDVTNETYVDISRFSAGFFMHFAKTIYIYIY